MSNELTDEKWGSLIFQSLLVRTSLRIISRFASARIMCNQETHYRSCFPNCLLSGWKLISPLDPNCVVPGIRHTRNEISPNPIMQINFYFNVFRLRFITPPAKTHGVTLFALSKPPLPIPVIVRLSAITGVPLVTFKLWVLLRHLRVRLKISNVSGVSTQSHDFLMAELVWRWLYFFYQFNFHSVIQPVLKCMLSLHLHRFPGDREKGKLP